MDEQIVKDSAKVHQGRNVRIARASKNITQEGLADLLNMKQKEISKLETLEVIDDAILENIALALNVNADFLKSFDIETASKNYYNNATLNSAENSQEMVNQGDQAQTFNYFPLSEVMEMTTKLLEMQKEHYEKEMVLLREKCEKDTEIALLKQENALLKNK